MPKKSNISTAVSTRRRSVRRRRNPQGSSSDKSDDFEVVAVRQKFFPPDLPGKNFHIQFRNQMTAGKTQVVHSGLNRRRRRQLPLFSVQKNLDEQDSSGIRVMDKNTRTLIHTTRFRV